MSDMMFVLRPADLPQLARDIRCGQVGHEPYYLELHLTDRCNSRCYFCNQQSRRRGAAAELALADVKRLVSRMARAGLRAVRLSGGGEPSLHPQVLNVLQLIRGLGVTLARFDTNGILLTPSLSHQLVQSGLKQLHLSLQAPTPDTWAAVSKRRASDFHRVIENLRQFIRTDRARRTDIYASFIMDQVTLDQVDAMIGLCKDLAIGYAIHELNSHTYAEDFLSAGLPRMKERIARLEDPHFFEYAPSPNDPPDASSFHERGRKRAGLESACLAPWVGVLIRPCGDVYLCCALTGTRHILGNIFAQDLKDIWHGAAFERVRQEAKHLFFRGLLPRAAQAGARSYQYLSRPFCPICPVHQGIFSDADWDLGKYFRKRERAGIGFPKALARHPSPAA